jgi:hypothetical protein
MCGQRDGGTGGWVPVRGAHGAAGVERKVERIKKNLDS